MRIFAATLATLATVFAMIDAFNPAHATPVMDIVMAIAAVTFAILSTKN